MPLNSINMLCFTDVMHETLYLRSWSTANYFLTVEGIFDVFNGLLGCALLYQAVSQAVGSTGTGAIRLTFNVLHVALAVIVVRVKLGLNRRPNAAKEREQLRAALHIFWTLFGTFLAPFHMWGVPIVDIPSFLQNLTATGISSPIILNLAMPLRMCYLLPVSCARFFIQMFLTPVNCAWWLRWPTGVTCVHTLWGGLHGVMLAGASMLTNLAAFLDLETPLLQSKKCEITSFFIQFIFGFFYPLYLAYIIERSHRITFSARSGGRGEMYEPGFMRRVFACRAQFAFGVMLPPIAWVVISSWAGIMEMPGTSWFSDFLDSLLRGS